MAANRNVLVLGATGGIGGEVARQLRDAGWQVRALKRGAKTSVEHMEGMTWVGGDALNRRDVLDAAEGCSVIVHAVNPPGYRRWSELVLPMLDNHRGGDRSKCNDRPTGHRLQLWPGCFSRIDGGIASAPGDPQGRHSSGTRASSARGQSARRPCNHRPSGRFLRPQGRQQLVLTGIGQAGPAGKGG